MIQITNNQTTTIYNGTGALFLQLNYNTNRMLSGTTFGRFNNFLYNGAWTYFSPGIFYFGPQAPQNLTGNTIATTKSTTSKPKAIKSS